MPSAPLARLAGPPLCGPCGGPVWRPGVEARCGGPVWRPGVERERLAAPMGPSMMGPSMGPPRTPNVPARCRGVGGDAQGVRCAAAGRRVGPAADGARVEAGAPRASVDRGRGARAEVRQDLVDHRRLRDERDEAHHAVAGRAREGIDFADLRQERRRRAYAHRRLASVGASLGAGTITGGAFAVAGSA